MIAFIEQEAAEKVEEIEAKGEEEFNIEKSRLVSQQRIKVMDHYDKKEKQIELQRKIQHSNLANASRFAILKARDDCIKDLKEFAKKELDFSKEDRAKYITILANLITQGLLVLMESKVIIRCRYDDYGLVQRLIPDAIRRYKDQSKEKSIQVTIDEKHFLSDHL
jgi:vacuolar-type H+-ATPase subunit E/Vma4